jgi:Uma2 family endonuclease
VWAPCDGLYSLTNPATLQFMSTVVLDPPPSGFEEILERRRALGQDRRDEMWEGVLHMSPSPSRPHAELVAQLLVLLSPPARVAGLTPSTDFNLGDSKNDYRSPDGGLHRPGTAEIWIPTAALVMEIVSPGDETWEKLLFYAAHNVDEVLIVDPKKRTIDWLALHEGGYRPIEYSGLIYLGPDQLAKQLGWPLRD